MAELRLPEKEGQGALEDSAKLWSELAAANLTDARLGRAFAIALFESGKRAPALSILALARGEVAGALESDLFEATLHLMKAAPAKPRVLTPKPPPAPEAQAPSKKKPGGAAGGKKPKGAAGPGQ